MEEKTLAVFLFLKVRARKSGQAVKLLSTAYDEIKEAAAVYAETDVIARASASEIRVGEILLELMQGAIHVHDKTHGTKDIFQVDSVQPYLVDGTLSRIQNENIKDSSGTIYAYVVIEIDERQGTRGQVLQELQQCDGIIYTAGLSVKPRVIAKVKAPNKMAFDNNIMEQIQSIAGVATTRSLLIINDMHFIRNESSKTLEVSMNPISDWAVKGRRR